MWISITNGPSAVFVENSFTCEYINIIFNMQDILFLVILIIDSYLVL